MFRKISVLMVIIAIASLLSAQTRFAQDERIAIIGAGASGLTAAFNLKKLGYENITVYEKENRIGGKVYSYNYSDFVFELGAFWAGAQYDTIFEMADYYGVESVTEDANMQVLKANGKNYNFEENLYKSYNFFQITWALLNFEWVRAKFRDDVKKIGYDNVDPELYMSFDKFIKKYHIEPLANAFRPFWIGCGYGYYDQTPAIFVLKLMMPSLENTLTGAIKNFLPFMQGDGGLIRFPKGYMSIFEYVAADISDLRLSSEVTSVERIVENGRPVIRVTANGQIEEFDKIIVTTDLRAAQKFMDISAEEAALFSQVKSYNYYIYLIEAKNVAYPMGSMIFLDKYGTSDTIGHMTALINRDKVPNVWTTGQLVPWGTPSSDIISWLKADVASIGGTVTNIIKEQQWNYFPYVNEASLRSGFYENLKELQGEKGTYFTGGIFNFETVEYTSVFAKDLVLRNF